MLEIDKMSVEAHKKQLQKKLIENSARRHDLWEGSGVLLKTADFEDEVRKTAEERDEIMRKLEFFKEAKPSHVEVQSGWYQDASGNLYKYDGVIWDPVPEARITDLEYLSGK